jgi:hypothetical protein
MTSELNETQMVRTALLAYADRLRRQSKTRPYNGPQNKHCRLNLRARANLYEALADSRYFIPEES